MKWGEGKVKLNLKLWSPLGNGPLASQNTIENELSYNSTPIQSY